jgi:hypothetical protein
MIAFLHDIGQQLINAEFPLFSHPDLIRHPIQPHALMSDLLKLLFFLTNPSPVAVTIQSGLFMGKWDFCGNIHSIVCQNTSLLTFSRAGSNNLVRLINH